MQAPLSSYGAAAGRRPLRLQPMTLAVAINWGYFAEFGDELLAGLGRTLLVSSIAVVGAFVIGLVLGAARAHRIPVVSQLAADLRRGDP